MTTLYLSRIAPNMYRRDVRRDLADCNALHERLLSAFPDDPAITSAREHFGVLYRAEPGGEGMGILVQSRIRPDWSRLPADYLRAPAAESKRVDGLYGSIAGGQELRFRLRANPTRRISDRSATTPERWRGKRVELREEEDQVGWLRRKGEQAGFALLAVRARPDVVDVRTRQAGGGVTGRSDGRRLTFGAVVFEGRLRVTDAERFRAALEGGIGSGKAFGFGLLSVAPTGERD